MNDLYATLAEVVGKDLPPVSGKGRGAEDSVSQLAALQGDVEFVRVGAIFPNDHQQASKKLADERAVVAVRTNAAPIEGQWKLFLDHRYAFNSQLHPTALYDLSKDPQETNNLLGNPKVKPILDHLLELAREAAGEAGSSR